MTQHKGIHKNCFKNFEGGQLPGLPVPGCGPDKTNILFVKRRKYCTHCQVKIKQQRVFYFDEDRNEWIALCECWNLMIAVIVLCMDLP